MIEDGSGCPEADVLLGQASDYYENLFRNTSELMTGRNSPAGVEEPLLLCVQVEYWMPHQDLRTLMVGITEVVTVLTSQHAIQHDCHAIAPRSATTFSRSFQPLRNGWQRRDCFANDYHAGPLAF